jgi:hypothetical protein
MILVMVSVDYADLLSITLPYNRHHFDRVLVVGSEKMDAASRSTALQNAAEWFSTEKFYEDGAMFNKWKALEEGLLYAKRMGWLEGWVCLMDADVMWPKELNWFDDGRGVLSCGISRTAGSCARSLELGQIWTPRRRMFTDLDESIPLEEEWRRYPYYRYEAEWSGYTQIFHTDDPHLGPLPWHQTDWKHAGGADSFFQMKWPPECKMRPPFEVLHLGGSAENWCGRVTPYVDGTVDPRAGERRAEMMRVWQMRREAGPGKFDGEKIERS